MKNVSYQNVLRATALPTPSSLLEGVFIHNTTDGYLYYCNGGTWINILQNSQGTPPGGSFAQVQYFGNTGFEGATNILIDQIDKTLLVKEPNPAVTLTGVGSDTVKLFTKRIANRMLLATVGPSAMDACVQPATWRQKIAYWNPPGNSNVVPAVDGMNAVTGLGTATARAVATTNLFTRTRRLGYVSAATAAAFAGHFQPQAQFTTGTGAGLGGFFYSCRFGFSDAAAVAGARAFIGLSNLVAAPTNVEPSTLTNCVGLAQLSTSSTQLYIVYGGSAAQAAIPLGTNFPPMAAAGAANGIMYDLTLFSPPNSNGVIHYYVERVGTSFVATGTLSGTAGTTTPANTTLLAHRAWRTNNATLLAVGIDIIGVYTETDY